MKQAIKTFAACMLAACMMPTLADSATYPAHGASRVVFKLPGELQLRQGEREEVKIDADAALLPKLDIALQGDTLVLGSRGSFKTDKPLKITVTLKSLRAFRSEGSGDALLSGFSSAALDIDSAGSGHLALSKLKAERLTLTVSGAGDIDAAGSGNTLSARISGTGNIDASAYPVSRADAVIAGSGEIRVDAKDELKAAIQGAGNIAYKGKPRLQQSVSGAGSVDPL